MELIYIFKRKFKQLIDIFKMRIILHIQKQNLYIAINMNDEKKKKSIFSPYVVFLLMKWFQYIFTNCNLLCEAMNNIESKHILFNLLFSYHLLSFTIIIFEISDKNLVWYSHGFLFPCITALEENFITSPTFMFKL